MNNKYEYTNNYMQQTEREIDIKNIAKLIGIVALPFIVLVPLYVSWMS